jgi:hypothetical protein
MPLAALLFAVALALAPPARATPCTDTEWLIKAYGDLLFRQPSQQEISSWIDPNSRLLVQQATRFEVAWAIATTNEGIGYLLGLYPQTVSGYFQDVLGRTPTNPEFATFYGQLGFPQGNAADFALLSLIIGGTLGQFSYANEFSAYAVAQNPAAAACGPSRAVVNQIFKVYMGRNGTQQELDFWTQQLNGGAALQEVALGIAGIFDVNVGQGTGEYFNRAVREAYQRFLRRAPGGQELVGWSNALAQNGLNQELWAVLMSQDEYCSGVVVPLQAQTPPPPAQIAQQLQVNVVGAPQQYSVGAPQQPAQVADGIQVLNVQQHVVAQNNTIVALAGGNIVPCIPDADHTCIFDTVPPPPPPPGQVIVDLTAQIGGLQTQVLTLGGTIQAQTQQIAQQQSTITSLVNAELGLPVDMSVASAARQVAADEIAQASTAATSTPAMRALAHAQLKFGAGEQALGEGDADQALRDYKDAYRDAARAASGP